MSWSRQVWRGLGRARRARRDCEGPRETDRDGEGRLRGS